MECTPIVKRLLATAGASEGDTVEARGERRSHRGVVMPHSSFSGDDILTLQLREYDGQ